MKIPKHIEKSIYQLEKYQYKTDMLQSIIVEWFESKGIGQSDIINKPNEFRLHLGKIILDTGATKFIDCLKNDNKKQSKILIYHYNCPDTKIITR